MGADAARAAKERMAMERLRIVTLISDVCTDV
jgi:hypothetical protein